MMARKQTDFDLPAYTGPLLDTDQLSTSEVAERYLVSLIFSGQLAPGDKLPSERELAAHFGIARITLRAALRSLESRGFLSIKIGSKGGAWINDVPTIRARWDEWMRTHKDQIREILEYRELVETKIAELAALHRTAKDLRLLEAVHRSELRPRPSPVHPHFGFHDALAKAAHNHYLERAMLTTRAELFVPAGWGLTDTRNQDLGDLHGQLLEAVRAKDAVRATELMRSHIEFAHKPFRTALKRRK